MTMFRKPYYYRRVTGSYVEGRWVSSEVRSLLHGSVQPLNGRELQFLDIARRDTGNVKVYSDIELHVSTEGSVNKGDVVEKDGKLWEVTNLLGYSSGIISHYKYVAAYIGEIS